MDTYDGLPAEARALVRDYGLNRGYKAYRMFYGRWDEARRYLEEERKALQSARWENI